MTSTVGSFGGWKGVHKCSPRGDDDVQGGEDADDGDDYDEVDDYDDDGDYDDDDDDDMSTNANWEPLSLGVKSKEDPISLPLH